MGGRGRWISEFVASLVYRVTSRTARAVTQRNPVSKKSMSSGLGVVVYAFGPNRGKRFCFKASVTYSVSSKPASATS